MTSTKPAAGTACGRLDVMGGITDYSGGLVVQKLLKEATTVVFTPRSDGRCIFVSNCFGDLRSAEVQLTELLVEGKPRLSHALNFFKSKSEIRWVAYVAGCFLVLMKEINLSFNGGEFQIESSVPLGKGVSSSAALEMATMRALREHFQFKQTELTLAGWAQVAENEVAGAPCGLMDQLSSALGEHGKLLPIHCQPNLVKVPVEIPESIHLVGLDSGHRHSVGDSPYILARCATFMGFTMILQDDDSMKKLIEQYRITRDRSLLPFGGYLCNIEYRDFFLQKLAKLPEKISGAVFRDQYGDHTDLNTQIDPDQTYSVRACTAHVVADHRRSQDFLKVLAQFNANPRIAPILMGKLMMESHRGYSECGLGSQYTDRILNLALEFGRNLITGGRVSGGGSGGTVCLLALGQEGLDAVLKIKFRLEQEWGKELSLFL